MGLYYLLQPGFNGAVEARQLKHVMQNGLDCTLVETKEGLQDIQNPLQPLMNGFFYMS